MDVTLALTRDCNLACSYCYARPHVAEHMSTGTAHAAIDLALGCEADSVRLGFFGGEPLLRWDDMMRFLDYAHEAAEKSSKRITSMLTTNGTLLTPARARILSERAVRVHVSLDGDRRMHETCRRAPDGSSSFDAACDGLRAMLAEEPDTAVAIVLDPANIEHFAPGVRFLAEEAGISHVIVNPNHRVAWDADARAALERAYEDVASFYMTRYRDGRPLRVNVFDMKIAWRLDGGASRCGLCGFAEREIAVAPSGRIYPCERMICGDDGRFAIGAVETGLDEERRAALLVRDAPGRRSCSACAIAGRCLSHCRATNHAATGRFDDPGEALCAHERVTARIADRIGDALLAEGCTAFVGSFTRFVPQTCV